MSEKPESIQGGADLSAFEAEFTGNEFDILKKEADDATYREAQVLRRMSDVARIQHEYDYEMAEADKTQEVPKKHARHLRNAYRAALDLTTLGESPVEGTFESLQARIAAAQALIDTESSSQSFDD
jgi:hypothetical protein